MKFLVLFIMVFLIPLMGHSVSILNIKGDRVLLDLDGEDLQPGDRLVAAASSGKGKGLMQIKQVKGSKAIATIIKGKIEVGYEIEKDEAKKNEESSDEELELEEEPEPKPKKKASKKKSRNPKSAWGLVVGMASNSMTVKPGNTTTALSGSSTNITGFYQRELDGSLSVRILGGSYNLIASGPSKDISACTAGGCKVEISYMGMESLVQYSMIKNSNLNLWAGAGLGVLFASSNSSNVLKTSTMSSTFLASLGVDWSISKDMFLPLSVDYVIFPDNSTSTASQMVIRFGFGSRF